MAGRYDFIFENSIEKLLFLLVNEVSSHTKVEFTKESILQKYEKRFEALNEGIDQLLNSLKQKGILEGSISNEKYKLTKLGEQNVNGILLKYLDASYSEILTTMDRSETFRKFATRLYGQYFGQLDLLDKEQIQKLVTLLENVSEHDKILDLGCGLGLLTEYLQEKTRAYFTGIDLASEAIKLATKRTIKNKKLKFIHGNMNELSFPDATFNIVLSIDTLYYVNDLKPTVTKLKQLVKPGGNLLLFFSQYRLSNEPDSFLTPDGTQLAQILHDLKLKFDHYDFTTNEMNHWLDQRRILEINKQDFFKEGNEYLFKTFYDDTQATLEQLEKNRFKRYLYQVFL